MKKEPKTFSKSPIWRRPMESKTVKNMMLDTERMKTELHRNGRVEMQYATNYDGYHVPMPVGNSKLGNLFRTLSLRPVVDCGNCSKCSGQCYDLRHDVTNSAALELRCLTSAILQTDYERFWQEVDAQARLSRFFRFHVGGDVLDDRYFHEMRTVAEHNPQCHFLCFTKMYDIANRSISMDGPLPENLHLFFSMWPGLPMDNPYNLPVAFPIFSEEDRQKYPELEAFHQQCPKFYWHCNDDCTECAICTVNPTDENKGQGCFRLTNGDAVGFAYH